MRAEVARKLVEAAEGLARKYSDPDRQRKEGWEKRFEVVGYPVVGETAAIVIFRKESGKTALAFFWWSGGDNGKGGWHYFFPSYGHFEVLRKIPEIQSRVEMMNFNVNTNRADDGHENLSQEV
jgi:hypothetical protein